MEAALSDPYIAFILWTGVVLISACLGSFTTAIIPREMAGLPWYSFRGDYARSQCALCQRSLRARELIPILSYVFQRGRSACCGRSIPLFYPAVETVMIMAACVIFALKGFHIWSCGLLFCLPFLFTAAWLNFKGIVIPDRLLILLSFISAATILIETNLKLDHAILGACVAGGATSLVKLCLDRFSQRALYDWDIVKLSVIFGFWLGWDLVGYYLFLMGLGGIFWYLSLRFNRETPKTPLNFPYCPWLLLGFWVLVLGF